MLQELPEDLQLKLLSLLKQREVARLSTSCKQLHSLAQPMLERTLRCVTCSHTLLQPRNIRPLDKKSRPRREFYELYSDTSHNLVVDSRCGAPNFHVIRHLRQTTFRNVRFPYPDELHAVNALRCPNCQVFVGFRHRGITGVSREYIHKSFVELIDKNGQVLSWDGEPVHHDSVSKCNSEQCQNQLFDCQDILPWTHVLSSKRLTDMNPYLEWDHSWAGHATASQPAFFVKRLKQNSYTLDNVRVENLRQGPMKVGDVHCAGCNKHVGWKLLAEVPQSDDGLLHNYDQVGRFGIIRSAVTPSQPLPNVIF